MKHDCSKKPQHIPYGQDRGRYWCDECDANLVPPEPNKKRARQKAKKLIKKELDND